MEGFQEPHLGNLASAEAGNHGEEPDSPQQTDAWRQKLGALMKDLHPELIHRDDLVLP